MTNQEKKQQLCVKQLESFAHLDGYFTTDVKGLDEGNVYFHIHFILDDSAFISSQSDIENVNKNPYAFKLNITENGILKSINIVDEWFENIVVGWGKNNGKVLQSLKALDSVQSHMRKIEQYTVDYVNNLILGESIDELTNICINELRVVSKTVNNLNK